jgi:uncharacterized sporulation protein YeaH/YhbH (DUF444 family)
MGEADKECEKLVFMTESENRDAMLRDLVMPDLLQQAFQEVRHTHTHAYRICSL